MALTIGELSKKFGIAASALRYYEKEGLISRVSRNDQGNRLFSEEDCERLILVDKLKKSGLSIKEISKFVSLNESGRESVNRRKEILEETLRKVKEQISELKDCKKFLTYEMWLLEQEQRLGERKAAKLLPNSVLPKKVRKVRDKISEICKKE